MYRSTHHFRVLAFFGKIHFLVFFYHIKAFFDTLHQCFFVRDKDASCGGKIEYIFYKRKRESLLSITK